MVETEREFISTYVRLCLEAAGMRYPFKPERKNYVFIQRVAAVCFIDDSAFSSLSCGI